MRHIAPVVVALASLLGGVTPARAATQPLAEHPRPDFERHEWLNLNGPWAFRFDPGGLGEEAGWSAAAPAAFPLTITVPFPWGSKLSGVEDEADIAWYARTIVVPEKWADQRVFLVVGASDWETTAWLDGAPLGRHSGGYTPFELELTAHMTPGHEQRLVLRIDDAPRAFKLEGKQGYGNARGIWQTVYLEARPQIFIETLHFLPNVDDGQVEVRTTLSGPAPKETTLALEFRTGDRAPVAVAIKRGERQARQAVALPGARLWSPADPFLYQVDAVRRSGREAATDRVASYFGMRKIGVADLPGSDFPYVTLNDRPLYLQMALDQSYHPDGFYTFPSDTFVRDEILRARRIGLNALRLHVKIDVPRKLYWADRLGMLLMEDVPNSWGAPVPEMRGETTKALSGMIRRDFNHPSIFSWVLFNETWGLQDEDEKKTYAEETQRWVESMWRLAKGLDPTRLIEDNSPCNQDHVATDIDTWHAYLPGYAWREHLDQVTRDTFPGSTWNFVGGRTQGREPLLNSECGNVWGYEGSTGDVDWSFDYHTMLNQLRRHPKVAGWLYTELTDVVNEWNGYYRVDRSAKETGLGALMPGMSLRDLHAPLFVAPGNDLVSDVRAGERVSVPLWASFLTDRAPDAELLLRATLVGWDSLGREETYSTTTRRLPFQAWMSSAIAPLEVTMPRKRALAILRLSLEDPSGRVLHRNFTTFDVGGQADAPRNETLSLGGHRARVMRVAPKDTAGAHWSLGQWKVLDGLKVDGAGAGYFEYRLSWPDDLVPGNVAAASFRAELGAKQLLTKDRAHAPKQEGDYMRGAGTADPALNPNAYPMTDATPFPSAVRLSVNGWPLATVDLSDDPADHRGLLSWHAQPRDRRLREAGSYGYLVSATIPAEALAAAAKEGEIVVRLEVDPALPGGLAVYGEHFGRYPLDPTVILHLR